jgi:hypothetical protein
MFAHTCLLVVLFLRTVSAENENPREINIALLEEFERDPSQWPAIVEWAVRLIRRDALVPDDYAIK